MHVWILANRIFKKFHQPTASLPPPPYSAVPMPLMSVTWTAHSIIVSKRSRFTKLWGAPTVKVERTICQLCPVKQTRCGLIPTWIHLPRMGLDDIHHIRVGWKCARGWKQLYTCSNCWLIAPSEGKPWQIWCHVLCREVEYTEKCNISTIVASWLDRLKDWH